MKTNSLAAAVALSDQDLLARIGVLASTERHTTADLVAHLAALELRPSLYAAQGYGTLFGYCTGALRLSEDVACNRIAAARACRRFPVILDLLASGDLSQAAIRMLLPHLTPANHEGILAKAKNRTRDEIEALIAELAPLPDVPASVRKLPVPAGECSVAPPTLLFEAPSLVDPSPQLSPEVGTIDVPRAASLPPLARPIVKASAPQRYRVQFTIDEKTHDKLRRVQALLRREIPNGDAGQVFGRALDLLLAEVEKAKLGGTSRQRPQRTTSSGAGTYETRIRPGTDPSPGAPGRSRHIPNQVKRRVWWRDAGQCAFVSSKGRRCTERSFLELHHIQPYAMDGPATLGNIALRCRRHNQYEAELVFGPRKESMAMNQAQTGYVMGIAAIAGSAAAGGRRRLERSPTLRRLRRRSSASGGTSCPAASS